MTGIINVLEHFPFIDDADSFVMIKALFFQHQDKISKREKLVTHHNVLFSFGMYHNSTWILYSDAYRFVRGGRGGSKHTLQETANIRQKLKQNCGTLRSLWQETSMWPRVYQTGVPNVCGIYKYSVTDVIHQFYPDVW